VRARSREINIFNMSLLDILCGALGAFCFMMLVLLPYYKPPDSAIDLQKERATTDELVKELERLKEAAKDSELARQMQDLMNKLQDQIKQLQGEVNQYASQNEQLTTENNKLKDDNQRQKNELETRTPFLVTVGAEDTSLDLDLYVDDSTANTNADGSIKRNPPFNPEQTRRHPTFWPGDITTTNINGVTMWMVRDTPTKSNYKIYVKPVTGAASRVTTNVSGRIEGPNNNWLIDLPKVQLTPSRFWTLIGTASRDAEGKLVFKEATQQERDAEWTKLSKGKPPPTAAPAASGAMPFSSGSPMPRTSGAPGLSKEEMDKRREEYIRRRSQGQNATASPNPQKSP